MLRSDHIAYTRTGTGPPMLLVHGLPATHTLWEPLIPKLAQHRTVYAIDLPGFGNSDAPSDEPLAITQLIAQLIGFTESLGFEEFDLVGHSFGGGVAATLAATIPDRVRSLVLITPLSLEPPPLVHAMKKSLVRGFVATSWRTAPKFVRRTGIRVLTRFNYGSAYIASRAQQISNELDRNDVVRSSCCLLDGFDFAAYRQRLDSLENARQVPILAIGGQRDRVIPYKHFRELCDVLTCAEHESFDDGVHVLMWQYPENVAHRIVNFVEHNRTVALERLLHG
ncbi:MAG: alpha/beta fold hydrolase [bacterium]|nr:alpha/beta fold hydrolase [Candidatus Kapabacteria bacterium]